MNNTALLKTLNSDFKRIFRNTDATAQSAWYRNELLRRGVKFSIDGRETVVPSFLKPCFVAEEHRKSLAFATRNVVSGLEKIGKAIVERGACFDGQIELLGHLSELSKIDPFYHGYQPCVRLDCFFNAEKAELTIIECNCGDPSGMGYIDVMTDLQLKLPTTRILGEEYVFKKDELLRTLRRMLLTKYSQFCEMRGWPKKENPSIALVCRNDSATSRDFGIIAAYFENRGHESYLVDPGSFIYDGERLVVKGIDAGIDIVYRDSIADIIGNERDSSGSVIEKSHALLAAFADHAICFVNPPSAAIGDFKSICSIMSDPKNRPMFTEEEWHCFQKHVPWTRPLVHSDCVYRDEKVADIAEFVKSNRELFVLKPNQGYGGFGIVLGFEKNHEEFCSSIDAILAQGIPYVVQERVDIPTEEFPIVEGNEFIGFKVMNVNLNLWAHDGEFVGAFARMSNDSIINVHQGGGMTPVFFFSKALNSKRFACDTERPLDRVAMPTTEQGTI